MNHIKGYTISIADIYDIPDYSFFLNIGNIIEIVNMGFMMVTSQQHIQHRILLSVEQYIEYKKVIKDNNIKMIENLYIVYRNPVKDFIEEKAWRNCFCSVM